jgi:hypothetical protein
MNFVKNTYRTLRGIKKVVEIAKKKHSQKLIYQDNKPAYFVDFYDLQEASNARMNSLVFCSENSLEDVLKTINKRNNIRLSLPKISKIIFKRKIKSCVINLDLKPIPLVWLSYSL